MFRTILFILILGSLLPGCDNKKNTTADNSGESAGISFDTIKKKEIEIRVDSINAAIRREGKLTSVPFPIYNPTDSLDYYTVNGEHTRFQLLMVTENTQIWPTYFVDNGELILVRHRNYRGDIAEPWAWETMIYLDKGDIVYCNDRKVDLTHEEMPGLIRNEEFHKCTRSKEELYALYTEYLTKINEYFDSLK